MANNNNFWNDIETFALIVTRRETNNVNNNFFKFLLTTYYILNYNYLNRKRKA